jgi:uncharacterized membrane protein
MLTIIQTLVLVALALLFILAGILHFTLLRDDFTRMVPPALPYPLQIVLITGALEILGGIGLLLEPTRRFAGIALIVYLVAVFPANAYAARNHIPFRGHPQPSIPVRLVIQLLLIALLWWVTQ